MIRKATPKDLDQIEAIYNEILTAEEEGTVTTGWIRGIYPHRGVAETALSKGTLYVLEENGNIVASAKIDQEQVAEYALVPWKYEASDTSVLVLHTLVVSPSAKHCGYGTQFVSFYEQYAKKHAFHVLRMDTNARNAAARSLYRKLGYREAAVIPCDFNGIPSVKMVCLEKPVSSVAETDENLV